MKSSVWGPHLWYVLHIMSYHSPDNMTKEIQKTYHTFYYNVRWIIPCVICKRHYTDNLYKNPPEKNCTSRNKMIDWMISMHNKANVALGKKVVTREMANKQYKVVDNRRILQALDVLVMLVKRFDIYAYCTFFKSLVLIFPNQRYKEALAPIVQKVSKGHVIDQNGFRRWYTDVFRKRYVELLGGNAPDLPRRSPPKPSNQNKMQPVQIATRLKSKNLSVK